MRCLACHTRVFRGIAATTASWGAASIIWSPPPAYSLSTGVDGGRCSRARNKLFILLAQTLTRLGVRYTWPEVRERYSAGLPGGAQAQRAEAVLAAAAAGAGSANMDDKVKLL